MDDVNSLCSFIRSAYILPLEYISVLPSPSLPRLLTTPTGCSIRPPVYSCILVHVSLHVSRPLPRLLITPTGCGWYRSIGRSSDLSGCHAPFPDLRYADYSHVNTEALSSGTWAVTTGRRVMVGSVLVQSAGLVALALAVGLQLDIICLSSTAGCQPYIYKGITDPACYHFRNRF